MTDVAAYLPAGAIRTSAALMFSAVADAYHRREPVSLDDLSFLVDEAVSLHRLVLDVGDGGAAVWLTDGTRVAATHVGS